jgi:hypothetical protein
VTAIQQAILLSLDNYRRACLLLSVEERVTLRSVIAAAIARDAAEAIRFLDNEQEREPA